MAIDSRGEDNGTIAVGGPSSPPEVLKREGYTVVVEVTASV
jgi:hypothetical protein